MKNEQVSIYFLTVLYAITVTKKKTKITDSHPQIDKMSSFKGTITHTLAKLTWPFDFDERNVAYEGGFY